MYLYNKYQTTFGTIIYPLFSLDENIRERKKKKENKNTCEYEREGCSKSC